MLDFWRNPSALLLALPEPSEETRRHLAELTEDQQTTDTELQEIGERPEEQVLRQVEELHEVARASDAQGATSSTELQSDQHGQGVEADPKPLTPRELELLLAMESRPGATQAEIGSVLGLKEKSVSRRLTDIRAKLRASKADDPVRIARERGMLDGQPRDTAEADYSSRSPQAGPTLTPPSLTTDINPMPRKVSQMTEGDLTCRTLVSLHPQHCNCWPPPRVSWRPASLRLSTLHRMPRVSRNCAARDCCETPYSKRADVAGQAG